MNLDIKSPWIEERLERMGWRKKILLLLTITIVVYGTAIAFTWSLAGNSGQATFDVDNYQARTQTILDGGLLYRDVHTESPPLINYFLVPAQLIAGAEQYWIWAAYEAFFAFLLASMLYLTFREHDDRKAFSVGVLTLLCPFLIEETSRGQDEALWIFLFFVTAILMLKDRERSAAFAIGIGIWTKMWSILLLPIQFLRLPTWRERLKLVIIVMAVSLLVTTPFLILCYDEFLEFLNFYFLGNPNRSSGGPSVWNFLALGGHGVPEVVELGLVLVSLALAYLYAHRSRMGVWESATLVVTVFIIFYPKMTMGYYILPFVLLAVWAAENWKIAIQPFLAFLMFGLATGFLPDEGGKLTAYFDYDWQIGLVLALAGTLLFVNAARMSLKLRPFITNTSAPPAHGVVE